MRIGLGLGSGLGLGFGFGFGFGLPPPETTRSSERRKETADTCEQWPVARR